MAGKDDLPGLIRSEVEKMTPRQVGAFKREITKKLPGFIRECGQEATRKPGSKKKEK